MEERRELKRARQACLNCRRKKTRCSGEMPVCAFCARLNQRCVWDSGKDCATPSSAPIPFNTPDSALAARVALLESKLSMLGADPVYNFSAPLSIEGFTNSNAVDRPDGTDENFHDSSASAPFSTLPAKSVLAELIDTYFTHCQNQPYAYFHEATFRQRFEEDALPVYLLYAVAATACRFSGNAQYREMQAEAITSYSDASWAQIFEQSFSYENDLDVAMVQAMNMLAVIDFTAGHQRLGWVKVALSVRFAQALRLNEEPDDQLPSWEQEERRRTFWSIYLLDQLISLGPNRPPTFSDGDCTVHLPCPDESFVNGMETPHMPTLEAAVDNPTSFHYQNLDYFGMTILMACALGRFIRFSLKRSPTDKHVPWDSRSAYYRIHSMLLHFESHSPFTYATLDEILQSQFTIGAIINQQRVGHLIFSQALFHVNHCLLNHPFILYHLFQRCSAPVPPSFAKEALQRSHSHATQLLDLLQDAQRCGRLAESSFFGYCAILPGVIFRLYGHHHDESIASISEERVITALHYLERRPVRWACHPHMATILRGFTPTAETARSLIDSTLLSQKTQIENSDSLWPLIDYASLQCADQRRSSTRTVSNASPSRADDRNLQQSLEIATTNQNAIPPPFLDFHGDFGVQDSDLQAYLGEDMGSLWAQVFNDQRSVDSV